MSSFVGVLVSDQWLRSQFTQVELRRLKSKLGLKMVNSVVSLAWFALVGGPARQDHPRAIEALMKLDVPYIVALALVFQKTEEWLNSTLGLHPIQVALQVALPELDGGMEPIFYFLFLA